jgi:DNA-binding response OmpR family regulator
MKKKILVIDDEPQILNSIIDYFTEYEIITAFNGCDGLRVLETINPDIIVADIVMPDMEGIEFIQTVRRKNISIPIIAMSGNPIGKIYLEDAIRFGANEKLEKPFELEELEKLITQMI